MRTHRQTRVGFDTPNRTLVMMAVNQSLPGSRQALEQRFSIHLLQSHRLRRIHPSKGRLRSFLLAALQNYSQNRLDWARERKRGGGQIRIPIDAVEPIETQDPAGVFDSQVHPGRLHPKGITDARTGVQADDDRDQLVPRRHVYEPHPFGHRQGHTLLDLLFGVGRELHPMRIKQNSLSRSPTPSTLGVVGDLSWWIASGAGDSGGSIF